MNHNFIGFSAISRVCTITYWNGITSRWILFLNQKVFWLLGFRLLLQNVIYFPASSIVGTITHRDRWPRRWVAARNLYLINIATIRFSRRSEHSSLECRKLIRIWQWPLLHFWNSASLAFSHSFTFRHLWFCHCGRLSIFLSLLWLGVFLFFWFGIFLIFLCLWVFSFCRVATPNLSTINITPIRFSRWSKHSPIECRKLLRIRQRSLLRRNIRFARRTLSCCSWIPFN